MGVEEQLLLHSFTSPKVFPPAPSPAYCFLKGVKTSLVTNILRTTSSSLPLVCAALYRQTNKLTSMCKVHRCLGLDHRLQSQPFTNLGLCRTFPTYWPQIPKPVPPPQLHGPFAELKWARSTLFPGNQHFLTKLFITWEVPFFFFYVAIETILLRPRRADSWI